jgi:hypothetical protein
MDGFIVIMASLSPVITMLVTLIIVILPLTRTSAFRREGNQQLNISVVIHDVSDIFKLCLYLYAVK